MSISTVCWHVQVRGQWPPKQQKTRDILHHVNLLWNNFTYCGLYLVDREDIEFAFKLAREAINKSIDQFLSTEGCTHGCCYSCVKQHVEVKLLNSVLPKCPHEGCGNELRIESCEKFLTPKFTEMMRQLLKEDSIPVAEKVYCPYPKCSTLMSKTEALRHPRSVYGFGARTCYKCHGNFCVYCRVPWHENLTCDEYKRRKSTSLVEESKLKNLAARKLWQLCIKCRRYIELEAGCNHLTCRCIIFTSFSCSSLCLVLLFGTLCLLYS
ncbi:putative IBR domain, Zinc finger, RING/FYVE/PHD-type, E3 ubiquitin ligase RBR family [Helianthus debilis subsp. tardiflorus]